MKILVIDIETAGLSPKKGCLVELGMCSLDLSTGKITELFSQVFREKHFQEEHYEEWIFENKYMTLEEVLAADDLEIHRDEIQAIFDGYQNNITAWNRPFDASFLEVRGFVLGKPMRDPMRDSTNYFELPGKYNYKWPKAQEAWDILFPDEEMVEEHRALSDAVMEAKIIHKLIVLGVYKD